MVYNLNESIVEDLRDLLTTQRRAFQRQGCLEAQVGNVFSFLVILLMSRLSEARSCRITVLLGYLSAMYTLRSACMHIL